MAVQVESQFGIPPVITAAVFATIVGMVIIGGIRRIGRVTAVLAPFMALLYVGAAVFILVLHWREVPGALGLIFQQAFAPEPLVGGAAGSFLITLMWGIRRGLFSNEAGQGSAPIAHAAAKTSEPVREGLVASLGPFIDTLVICTMTGLVILVSGVWKEKVEQTLSLGEVEVVMTSSPSDGDLSELWRERGFRSGSMEVGVTDGVVEGVGFVYLDAVLEDPRVVDADGVPWNGVVTIELPDGSVSASDTGVGVRGFGLLTSSPLTALGFRAGLPGAFGVFAAAVDDAAVGALGTFPFEGELDVVVHLGGDDVAAAAPRHNT